MSLFMPFRFKAFLIHLLFSVSIALVGLYVVFFVWHPAPLHTAVGVTSIYLIMLAIDATLGPFLTLILAKKGKKGLKLDLTIVVLLQLSAYFYGMYSIAISRPAWVVFDVFRFDVVQANEIDKSNIEKAKPIYQQTSWFGPKYVAVKPSLSIEEKNRRLFYEVENNISPAMQPQLYESLGSAWQKIKKEQKPLQDLRKWNDSHAVRAVLRTHPNATGWLYLKAYHEPMVVLVDAKNQRVLGIVDLKPGQ